MRGNTTPSASTPRRTRQRRARLPLHPDPDGPASKLAITDEDEWGNKDVLGWSTTYAKAAKFGAIRFLP